MLFTKEQIKNIRKAFEDIDRQELARLLVNSGQRNYVDQIATGIKVVSAKRAVLIEKLTFGRIKRATLRPDIFGN